jgi:hypothetical protein
MRLPFDFNTYVISAKDLNEDVLTMISIVLDREYPKDSLSMSLPCLQWSGCGQLVPLGTILNFSFPLALIITPSSRMMAHWMVLPSIATRHFENGVTKRLKHE